MDQQNTPARRRLAAVLAADIKGFSRMMGQDEDGTIERVTRQLSHIADAVVSTHHGRIFKTTGDGFLAMFDSPVDAVRCAIAFQLSVVEQNALLPLSQRLQYRIGVNLGDVVASGDDFYGDSINIAARLEGVADPGGICVSGSVYDQVKNRLACAFVFVGEEQFKNIAGRTPVYRIVMEEAAPPRRRIAPVAAATTAALAVAAAGVGWAAWTGHWPWHTRAGDGSRAIAAIDGPAVSAVSPGGIADQRRDAAFQRMLAAMQDSRFNWRTLERLAIDAGISEAEAHEILAAHPKDVILGKSRDGKLIARLPER